MEPEAGVHRARLYSAAQVRELDRRAINEHGIPGYALMQRAARAGFETLREYWPDARRVAICCGPGNNGGDGYEIARLARAAGLQVQVFQVGRAAAVGDAVRARAAWHEDGGETQAFDPQASSQLGEAEVIVDAIFGIGITREVGGAPRSAIEGINARRHGQQVLAVDLPSGLDADTGQIHGVAVRADVSLSFIGRKLGTYTGTGPDCAGRRRHDALGVPDVLLESSDARADLLDRSELRQALPPRARSAHKGRHGHVLIVGGDEGMAGAALLAARGSLRAGAGLVSLATRSAHAVALTAAQPEIMARGVDTANALDGLLDRASVIAVGPGLGLGDWSLELVERVLACGKPMVLDADALNLLARRPRMLSPAAILTPHPAEAARLLGVSTAEVQADRLAAAEALRARYGATIVLKGAGSIVVGVRRAVCPYGNPGMGVGGSGDVLTGVIAALLAQGLSAESAARCGVMGHALAGDLVAGKGERGLLPSDLVDALRGVLNPR